MENLQRNQERISELLRVSNVFERINLFDSSDLETNLKPKGEVIISDLWFFKSNLSKSSNDTVKSDQTFKEFHKNKQILEQFFSNTLKGMYLLHDEENIYQDKEVFYIPSKGEKALLFLISKYSDIWENSKQILKRVLQKEDINFNNYSEEEIASALIVINILSFRLSSISVNIDLKGEMRYRLIASKKYNETLRFLYIYQSNILENFVEYIKL